MLYLLPFMQAPHKQKYFTILPSRNTSQTASKQYKQQQKKNKKTHLSSTTTTTTTHLITHPSPAHHKNKTNCL